MTRSSEEQEEEEEEEPRHWDVQTGNTNKTDALFGRNSFALARCFIPLPRALARHPFQHERTAHWSARYFLGFKPYFKENQTNPPHPLHSTRPHPNTPGCSFLIVRKLCGLDGARSLARACRRSATGSACDSGLRFWMSAAEPERRALHEDAAGKCLREGRMRCAGRRWSCSLSCARAERCTATSAPTSSTPSGIWADRTTRTPVSSDSGSFTFSFKRVPFFKF